MKFIKSLLKYYLKKMLTPHPKYEALIVYFDALMKFKSINVPVHINYHLRMYCLKRGIKTFRGALNKRSRIIYIK